MHDETFGIFHIVAIGRRRQICPGSGSGGSGLAGCLLANSAGDGFFLLPDLGGQASVLFLEERGFGEPSLEAGLGVDHDPQLGIFGRLQLDSGVLGFDPVALGILDRACPFRLDRFGLRFEGSGPDRGSRSGFRFGTARGYADVPPRLDHRSGAGR